MPEPEDVDLFRVYEEGDEIPDWEVKSAGPSPTPEGEETSSDDDL